VKHLLDQPKRLSNGELKKTLLRQGRCGNRWCQKPLVPRTVDGRLYFEPCEQCSRFAKGRCYECNQPLRPVDKHGNGIPSRWHMRGPYGCYYQRIKFVRRAAQRRKRARGTPLRELKRKAAKYIVERKEILVFNSKRRRARGLKRQLSQRTRPCPEPGCKNLMTYTSRPPDRCDPCWERMRG
jgi:hypothetical protein